MTAHVATVAISRIEDISCQEQIERAVRESVTAACDFASVCRGQRVVLKPNVFCPLPAPVTTDPRVVGALIRLAYAHGARNVVVAEGRSISTARFRQKACTTRACFEAVGMEKAARDNGADAVYLEEDDFVEISNPHAVVLHTAHIARTIAEAGVLINVPVLKNHSLTLTTLGIKNLHGVVSDEDKLFAHDFRRINAKLVDILEYVKPALTVIDGVQGLEGDHADLGKPLPTGLIISSKDTVAADAAAEAIMGLGILEVETTRIAHERRLGVGDIRLLNITGKKLDSVRHSFARPDTEISESRFPGIRVRAGVYCRGCEYYIRRGIDRLVSEGILDPADPITLVFGREPECPPDIDGRVVIIGDCAMSSESVKRLRDRLWLTGKLKTIFCCPPMEFRMRAVELALD